MSTSKAVLQAVAVTLELTGSTISEAAARVLADDLAEYPEAQVLAALKRCRAEIKGGRGLSLADIVSRLDDGRPGPQEAWAMVPRDEYVTVVWTDEMREAWGVAARLLGEDEIAARMAFLEAYTERVTAARAAKRAPRWMVSIGQDAGGREAVLMAAVERGLITAEHAQKFMPLPAPTNETRQLVQAMQDALADDVRLMRAA